MLERGALVPIEAECIREEAHGLPLRADAGAALDLIDRARADPRALGEFLLRPPGVAAIAAHEHAERRRPHLRGAAFALLGFARQRPRQAHRCPPSDQITKLPLREIVAWRAVRGKRAVRRDAPFLRADPRVLPRLPRRRCRSFSL